MSSGWWWKSVDFALRFGSNFINANFEFCNNSQVGYVLDLNELETLFELLRQIVWWLETNINVLKKKKKVLKASSIKQCNTNSLTIYYIENNKYLISDQNQHLTITIFVHIS